MQTPQRGRKESREPMKNRESLRGTDAASATVAAGMSPVTVYDQMEREQEAIVNRLQREISTLKAERSRSRSRSVSSTHSSSSVRHSMDLAGRVTRGSFSDEGMRREIELLRRRIADLTRKLAERDGEIERLKALVNMGECPSPSSASRNGSSLNFRVPESAPSSSSELENEKSDRGNN